eukprot:Colp12_sorted_trinity150504_noHs@17327
MSSMGNLKNDNKSLTLSQLPDVVLLLIMSHLPPPDLTSLLAVSTDIRRLKEAAFRECLRTRPWHYFALKGEGSCLTTGMGLVCSSSSSLAFALAECWRYIKSPSLAGLWLNEINSRDGFKKLSFVETVGEALRTYVTVTKGGPRFKVLKYIRSCVTALDGSLWDRLNSWFEQRTSLGFMQFFLPYEPEPLEYEADYHTLYTYAVICDHGDPIVCAIANNHVCFLKEILANRLSSYRRGFNLSPARYGQAAALTLHKYHMFCTGLGRSECEEVVTPVFKTILFDIFPQLRELPEMEPLHLVVAILNIHAQGQCPDVNAISKFMLWDLALRCIVHGGVESLKQARQAVKARCALSLSINKDLDEYESTLSLYRLYTAAGHKQHTWESVWGPLPRTDYHGI